jgi:hypothetical protein
MKNIRWIIQNNLIHENDLKAVQNSCKDMDVEFEEVMVIPFSSEIPEFKMDDKVNIYYGSTTLMYNIYHQHNRPAGLFFDEEAFSIENYMKHWGEHMLNSDAKVTTFNEFSKENHDDESVWFIRPDADDKSFNGQTKTFKEIKDWTSSFQVFENITLDGNTKIIAGEPYNIKKEWRNYIVDGKVVTSSLYRQDFRLKKVREDAPEEMIKFVEDRCKEYQPHKIFAMDIALCGGDYYIIECGCMNSVGLYACDIPKLVRAITESVSSETFSQI